MVVSFPLQCVKTPVCGRDVSELYFKTIHRDIKKTIHSLLKLDSGWIQINVLPEEQFFHP